MWAGRLHDGHIPPVVQLVLQPGEVGELLQLLKLPVSLVADQGAVEVHGEDDEDQPKGHHDGGWGDGGRHASRKRAVVLFGLDRQELDPAEKDYLGEEEEGANDGGERPRKLDVPVHALVGWLLHWVEVVHVADGLDVGQDARADHQGEQVHGHEHSGAGAEGDEQGGRVRVAVVQLHFHHGHLRNVQVEKTRRTNS